MLRRLDHAGLLPAGADAARQSIPQEEIAALLAHAAAADTTSAIAATWLHEFTSEFTPRIGALSLATLASYHMRENHVLAGVGYDTVWTGARPTADESDAEALVRASIASRHLALAASVDGSAFEELQLVLAGGAIGVWGGRREVGYSVGHAGGMILDATRLDGAGAFLTRPVMLPLVGPVRLEMHVAKIDNVLNYLNAQNEIEPYFWTARLAGELHPRLRLSVSRGIMFGGEGNVEITATRLLRQLLGIYTSDDLDDSFAAQMASIDVRYRLPTGATPITAYLEWGFDDGRGAIFRVPGITAGAEFSGLPKRDVAVGIERTEFVRNTLVNSHWYQNGWFRGSWADGGELLGHPLAGHGKEWRVFASGGVPSRGITADAAVYKRWRGDNNLFSPQRQGSSLGAALEADASVTRLIRLVLSGEVESGDRDWTASAARIGLRFVF